MSASHGVGPLPFGAPPRVSLPLRLGHAGHGSLPLSEPGMVPVIAIYGGLYAAVGLGKVTDIDGFEPQVRTDPALDRMVFRCLQVPKAARPLGVPLSFVVLGSHLSRSCGQLAGVSSQALDWWIIESHTMEAFVEKQARLASASSRSAAPLTPRFVPSQCGSCAVYRALAGVPFCARCRGAPLPHLVPPPGSSAGVGHGSQPASAGLR